MVKYKGQYKDKNVTLKAGFKSACWKMRVRGRRKPIGKCNRNLTFQLLSKNKLIKNGKIILNNIVFHIKANQTPLKIKLHKSKSQYQIKLSYTINHSDYKKHWKKALPLKKITKNLIIKLKRIRPRRGILKISVIK